MKQSGAQINVEHKKFAVVEKTLDTCVEPPISAKCGAGRRTVFIVIPVNDANVDRHAKR